MSIAVADHITISDHLARYCWAVDEGDEAGWVALWTRDGVFAGQVTVEGAEALAGIVKMVQRQGPGKTRHSISNLYCDYGEGNDVVHVSFYNLITKWVEQPSLSALVVTKGVLLRNGDGWLIKRLDLKMVSAA